MRLLPYRYTRWAMNAYARETGNAACVYAHPWELDPEQPRMSGRLTSRIRHYIGLKSMQGKLRRLIDEFDFTTLASLAPAVLEGAPAERQAAAAGVA
jgi:hypothetical protein